MFKNLREKLKSWVKKNNDSEELDEVIEDKKEDERLDKVKKKEGKKEAREKKGGEKKSSKNKVSEELGEVFEDTKELIEEIEYRVEDFEEVIEEVSEEELNKDNAKKKFKSGFFKKNLTSEMFDEMFEELELILMQNNVAVEVIDKIRNSMKDRLVGENSRGLDIAGKLKVAIEEQLVEPFDFIERVKSGIKEKSPFVILFAGINGAGKTTTIAKVVNLLKKNDLSCCVVAGDTFRAAAIQQLEEHAKRLGVPIIKKDYGVDPASVGFDGIAYAKKHKIDVVLIDTAGRLQNRDSLMKEIEKISRVTKSDMKIFLGESITGNDATEQAKVFNETIDFDGIILSKADVDDRGGTAISVGSVTGKPILFLGIGQNYDDLEVFDKSKIIEQLGL